MPLIYVVQTIENTHETQTAEVALGAYNVVSDVCPGSVEQAGSDSLQEIETGVQGPPQSLYHHDGHHH